MDKWTVWRKANSITSWQRWNKYPELRFVTFRHQWDENLYRKPGLPLEAHAVKSPGVERARPDSHCPGVAVKVITQVRIWCRISDYEPDIASLIQLSFAKAFHIKYITEHPLQFFPHSVLEILVRLMLTWHLWNHSEVRDVATCQPTMGVMLSI